MFLIITSFYRTGKLLVEEISFFIRLLKEKNINICGQKARRNLSNQNVEL